MPETPWRRARPLVLFGLLIVGVRFAAEFVARDDAMMFGVHYLMPAAILVVGWWRGFGALRWLQLLATMAVVGLCVWSLPNAVIYTLGQFFEWTHGRFHAGDEAGEGARAAPVAATVLGKLGAGLLHGVISFVTGTLWCTIAGTLFVWLPARVFRRGVQSA